VWTFKNCLLFETTYPNYWNILILLMYTAWNISWWHTYSHTPIVFILTYLLTPWNRVLLEKLTGSAASREIPCFFGTRKFITVLTSARHLPLSWTNSIQSPPPPPTSWRSVLILSSHLCLGLPSDLFTSGFPPRTLYTPPPYTPHAPPISFF